MKKSFYILVLTGCVLNLMFTISCDDTPTYEDLKSAEQKVIKRILSEKNISVLSEYPESGVFKDNEFVLLNSGIYLNVIDSGNGNRAVPYSTDILLRMSGEYYDDTAIYFNTFTNALYPLEFRYGNAYGVVQERASYDELYYYFFGTGLESILSYVGDSAIVKLLVPGYAEVNGGSACSTMQNGNSTKFIPIYYDKIRYTFY